MALRTFQVLRYMKTKQSFFKSIRLESTISHKSNVIKPKEYTTEDNLIYYEDPDNFGTLSGQYSSLRKNDIDEGDLEEENYLENKPLSTQKLTTKQYADLIKQYLKHRRLKDALDVLEIRMLTEDRVHPENYIYNILIGACADVGYTKKSFKLYNDMKRRALKVTGDTYTCLFNACANSPWPSDGLKNANHLRQLMIEKGVNLNLTNYNAMIKAFGRCGDLSTAFQIVDEMMSKDIKIRVHTFNFLLQACISDKNAGLRHALVVWRKMLKLREKPNIYSFNLMLKCVKDCNLGAKQDIEELVGFIKQNLLTDISKQTFKKQELLPTVDLKDNDITNDNMCTSVVIRDRMQLDIADGLNQDTYPNLLSRVPNMQQVLRLQEVTTAQDKFAVIGGEVNFLNEMKLYSVNPNIKTFTQMLPLLEDNIEAEVKFLDLMKQYKVRTDISFYNMLIKKRCMRNDYSAAFSVKDMINAENTIRKKDHPMKKSKLKCDIITYGVLAMACRTKEDAEKLLETMRNEQLKLNAEIMSTLLKQGTVQTNFGYVLYVMNVVKKEKLQINEIFLNHLEIFNEKCKDLIMKMNEGNRKHSEVFIKSYEIYMNTYKKWLQDVNIEEALKTEHPWHQFRDPIPQTVQRQYVIEEPKRFYKRNRKYVKPYSV